MTAYIDVNRDKIISKDYFDECLSVVKILIIEKMEWRENRISMELDGHGWFKIEKDRDSKSIFTQTKQR